MSYVEESYTVTYNSETVGYYYVFDDQTVSYHVALSIPEEHKKELRALGLNKDREEQQPIRLFSGLIDDAHRVPGRKRIMYQDGPLMLEREPKETGERFSVYRRSADKGDPDYSPLPHDAPHYEGPNTPKGMREWASWYAFNKLDDGTYQAELDEAWWWGGSHNDGGTIRREIPEEWFDLPYDEFLQNVVRLAAAAHYGFTAEMLREKEGLKAFFGFGE